MRVAKVAQKEPMETVHCTLLETGERRSNRLCNVPGVCSSAHVLCKIVKKVFLNNPWVVRPAVAHKRSAQHTFWP